MHAHPCLHIPAHSCSHTHQHTHIIYIHAWHTHTHTYTRHAHIYKNKAKTFPFTDRFSQNRVCCDLWPKSLGNRWGNKKYMTATLREDRKGNGGGVWGYGFVLKHLLIIRERDGSEPLLCAASRLVIWGAHPSWPLRPSFQKSLVQLARTTLRHSAAKCKAKHLE